MSPSPSAERAADVAGIEAAVDALIPDLIAFTQALIRIPSLPGGEQTAQRAIAARYESLALTTEIVPTLREDVEHHPAFCDDAIPFVDRLNVVARWPGRGQGRSLILNGHMDVVPPGDLAKWRQDPWGAHIDGDRLYGRGSCDMKAGLAAAVFAVQALQSLGVRPGGDVLLQSVIGEESGGVGTLTTIVRGYRADACVIMEPMDLRICPVHSGALTFRLTVHGRGAHASMKSSGVSAIEEFAPLLEALERLNTERHLRFQHPLFDDAENVAPISVGTLRAGDWPSSVPDLLVAEGRVGTFPGEALDDARTWFMTAIHEAARRSPWLALHPPAVEWFEGQFESGSTATDSPIVQMVAACHETVTGAPTSLFGIPSGTDLRLFTRHAGIPTLMYGPGSVAQAHGADEFVSIREVITCTKVLARTIVEWCGV